MKVSLNWLNEFVDLSGIDIKEIVAKLSLASAEIEGYEIKKPEIDCVVAEVKTCEKKEGTHLSILSVFDGKKNYRVICGAPNIRAGLLVAFANKLPAKVISGVESQGMCMSAKELGISNDHTGIMELPNDARAFIGKSITEYMPYICDTIIEIDNKTITNRPDMWGHYGIARELAVIFDRKLKPLNTVDLKKYDTMPKYPVAIESDACNAYAVVRVNNITRKTAPLEMQTRLYYLGFNPHGFLVDLSNYIMLETAQPNHTFDAGRVAKISVGNLDGGSFTTLLDQKVKIDKSMLFIKSNGTPVALAGLIGGKDSEITENTTDTVIEFANFDSATVRKTAIKIGIRTDSSARFEKTLDTNFMEVGAGRMLYLITKLDKSAVVASAYSRAVKNETKTIPLSVDKNYAEKFCGVKFNWANVTKCLTGLGFSPRAVGDKIAVTVPSWRASKDVTCNADVIEEIIRTHGYDKITPVPPRVDIKPVPSVARKTLFNKISDALANVYACGEVHTYLWSDTPSALRVVNSAVGGCEYIRESLAPTLIKIYEKNKLNVENVRIFEIGSVVAGVKEQKHLCVLMPSYTELAQVIREMFGAKFVIGAIRHRDYAHPKNNASITIHNKPVGCIAQVIGHDIAVAEIVLDLIIGENIAGSVGGTKIFDTPSKYQKNKLDFTFEHSGSLCYGDVEAIFDKFRHPLNMGYKLKDVFENRYTLQFTVGSFDKTLTSDDINDIWSKIIAFGRQNGLTLRE